MIWEAEKQGKLKSVVELVERRSGNTGVALAFVAAARGYKLTLTMTESMSLERRKLLKALGANLELTEAAKGMKGAIAKQKRLMPATQKIFCSSSNSITQLTRRFMKRPQAQRFGMQQMVKSMCLLLV